MGNHLTSGLIDYFGYRDCPYLDNGVVRVILGPHCGGRVLAYAGRGGNVLYLDPAQAGRIWQMGEPEFIPCAGRFDIGMNREIPVHPELWLGAWESRFTGEGSVQLTSVVDGASRLQAVRDFVLDPAEGRLRCVQTIVNHGDTTLHVASWSRTFVTGGGIFVTPIRSDSVHSDGFVVHQDGTTVCPGDDPNARVEEGLFVVRDTPRYKWYGLDNHADWLAYALPGNQLFAKRFPVFPHRHYGGRERYNIVLWHMGPRYCELEPFGPVVPLGPGQRTSFCEDWWLLPCPLSEDRSGTAARVIGESVRQHTAKVEWDESLIGPVD